jgi:hypothetical protein
MVAAYLDHSQDKHASSIYRGARAPLCQTFILRLAAILADVLLPSPAAKYSRR